MSFQLICRYNLKPENIYKTKYFYVMDKNLNAFRRVREHTTILISCDMLNISQLCQVENSRVYGKRISFQRLLEVQHGIRTAIESVIFCWNGIEVVRCFLRNVMKSYKEAVCYLLFSTYGRTRQFRIPAAAAVNRDISTGTITTEFPETLQKPDGRAIRKPYTRRFVGLCFLILGGKLKRPMDARNGRI